MDKKNLKELIKPLKEGIPEYIKVRQNSHSEKEDHSFTTVRSTNYQGREVKIETTYKITIDGKPFNTHVGVLNDGRVYSHSLPQYSFSSAISMIKKIIRTFHDVVLPENELGLTKKHH